VIQLVFLKKLIFLFKIKKFIFLDRFNILISKIIFKNKKIYFDAFLRKKYFEPSPLLQSQTGNVLFKIIFYLKIYKNNFFNFLH